MLHAKIIDIEKNKIKTSEAEAFIKSSTYGASIIFTGNVRNINENKEVSLDFAAYHGGGSLQDFSIIGPNVAIKIRGLYFTDNRGLKITNLTTDFTYSKTQMKFYNTTIQTKSSTIKTEIDFNYGGKFAS